MATEAYDALYNLRTQFLNAIANNSLKSIDSLQRTWTLIEMELALYNLAVEKSDTEAAAVHLAKIEELVEGTDLQITYQSYLLRELKLEKFEDVSSVQTFEMPANSLLQSVDINWVSGTPVVSVGITAGGKTIMGDRDDCISGTDSNNIIHKSFPAAQTIYINISGGTVNINLDYETNYFSS